MSNAQVPFLKWAGGKRWILKSHQVNFPKKYNRYMEPFLGGAALFLHLNPKNSLISDVNQELINTYKAIRDFPEEMENALAEYQVKHSKEYYYQVRSKQYDDLVEQAARFLYLNRTCWNGLYRVNMKGNFNVPIGTKDTVILKTDDFQGTSKILQEAEISCCDFEETIDQAMEGDFLFIDPPYTANHNMNGFIKYNEKLFSWNDQVRLNEALLRAKDRGAYILLCNADHDSIQKLFCDIGQYQSVSRQSVLAASSNHRKSTTEAVFVSWL